VIVSFSSGKERRTYGNAWVVDKMF